MKGQKKEVDGGSGGDSEQRNRSHVDLGKFSLKFCASVKQF